MLAGRQQDMKKCENVASDLLGILILAHFHCNYKKLRHFALP